jgi:predicted GH43/DUF377 family glycosyl hydrolase
MGRRFLTGGSETVGLRLSQKNGPVKVTAVFPALFILSAARLTCAQAAPVLKADSFQHYVDTFNEHDEELYVQHVPNAQTWKFLKANIPLFECPDKDFERTYYFRWWTYRKHIKKTPDGFVITEFLPSVPWSGKYNTISCPAGHHFYEGRWLHTAKYLDDYALFWFRGGGNPRLYSFWAADAMYARYLVNHDKEYLVGLLDHLIKNYQAWEKGWKRGKLNIGLRENGLFFQIDDRDGMEMSIGGHGYRPTINSYMYGDATAIAKIAELAGKNDLARTYQAKAARIKKLFQARLWDTEAKFFKTLPQGEDKTPVDVRELHGYTPWYFNLPDAGHEQAWAQLMDPKGFYARFGPTTAEQRHPRFAVSYHGHECQWNGPSWPFATTQTLVALANLLNNYKQDVIGKSDYFETLRIYTKSHRLKREDGQVVPWIDENLNPYTGDWLARTRLKTWKNGTWDPHKGGKERGKDYNHSGYCDLIISGLVGLRPRADNIVVVNPLIPADTWDWFCLDNVFYHGRMVTILWDRTGKKYNRGKGLRVFADGTQIAQSDVLCRISGQLPAAGYDQQKRTREGETATGWQKYENNPVLGGKLGTCFDVAVLRERSAYRMYFSWRPKKSVGLVESPDGIHWGEPRIVLGPNPESGWEDNINRPIVAKRKGTYHMWYTGQATGRSWIGYATSNDGMAWKRASDQPVLAAEEPWEKVAVMCPHVTWDEGQSLFRMWYSGGEQYEPDAIGYATSADGLRWTKSPSNPIFAGDPNNEWERHKVTACQVIRHGNSYLMFYIGFKDVHSAQIGVARSPDGVTNWQRHPENPIISPGQNTWDGDACYKPFAIYQQEKDRWVLWYNGRVKDLERIGIAIHEGEDLGF